MPGYRAVVQIYIVVVASLAACMLVGTWVTGAVQIDQPMLLTMVLMLAINLASEHYVITLPRGGDLAASTIPQIASMFILPPPLVLLIVAASTIVEDTLSRKAWYKGLFNTGQMILAVGIPAHLINSFGSAETLFRGDPTFGMPLAIAAVVLYYIINTLLTNTVIALDRRTSVVGVWLTNNSTSAVLEFGMGIIGVVWAYIWSWSPAWSALAVCPALMACQAFSHIRRLEDENEKGIACMAEAIDARDAYTFQHSKRVAEYTTKLARELRLGSHYVDILSATARLHDLGKMGISNEVLHKSSGLSGEELEVMRRHPEIGAAILGHYQLYRDQVDCVLHHHERYDGAGYPHGLKGESIPIGARILAVADAFEAMTSDRPYRRALSHEQAAEELRAGGGRQFDPMVVGAFLKILDREPSAQSAPASLDERDDPTCQHGIARADMANRTLEEARLRSA